MDKKTFNDLVDTLPYLKKRGAFGFNNLEGFSWTANPTKKWKEEFSVIIDNWERFYYLDCPYDNVHLFVVEQILEEATNKLEMKKYLNIYIN